MSPKYAPDYVPIIDMQHSIEDAIKAIPNIENGLYILWHIASLRGQTMKEDMQDFNKTPEGQTYIRAIDQFYHSLDQTYSLALVLIQLQKSFDVKVQAVIQDYKELL